MLKDINKTQIQKFPATRSSVIAHFWIVTRTTSSYYVYLYPVYKICLFLVDQQVIFNCLGLFHICTDTKLKKKLNCPCAVTTCSRKASFFWMAELPGQLFTCTVTFLKVMEKKGTLSTKWIVPLIARCWLGRDFFCFLPMQRMSSRAAHPEPKLIKVWPDSLPCWLHGNVPSSLLGIF